MKIKRGGVMSITLLILSGCQVSTEETPGSVNRQVKKVPKKTNKGIGQIVSINTDEQFVLVKVEKPDLAKGMEYFYIERGTRSAVLKPTGEKIGNYYAADIVNGKVSLKDPVIVKVAPPEPPAEPKPVVKEPVAEKAAEPPAETIQQSSPPTPVEIAPEPTPPVPPAAAAPSAPVNATSPPIEKNAAETPTAAVPKPAAPKPIPPADPNRIPIDLPPGYKPGN